MDPQETIDRMPHAKDLTRPIDPEVIDNRGRMPDYYSVADGLKQELFLNNPILGDRLSRRVKADQHWFETLIGHAPTVGTFYESLLRDVLNEMKPDRLSIGTGFVYDYSRSKHSLQLDIIVYDTTDIAPIYRNREFVVVSPEAVVSVAEVKKTLTVAELRSVIRRSVNDRFGTPGYADPSEQRIHIFGYSSKSKTLNVAKCVAAELNDFLKHFHYKTRSGEDVLLPTRHITLPQIHFFDRDEFIKTEVECAADGRCRIAIRVMYSAHRTDDGLNEFLKSMISDDSNNTADLYAVSLFRDQYVLEVPLSFQLVTKMDIRSLAHKFPSERVALSRWASKWRQPIAALVPFKFDWTTVSTFDEFHKNPSIVWE